MIDKFVFGKHYRIVANTCSHGFIKGEVVVCTHDRLEYERAVSLDGDRDYFVELADVEEIEPSAPKAPVVRSRIYTVVMEGDEENFLAVTAERDYARLVKAELGGKVSGYKIIQFVAEKEIR